MLRPSPTLARKDFGLNDGRRLIAMTQPSSYAPLKSKPFLIIKHLSRRAILNRPSFNSPLLRFEVQKVSDFG
jgi:hypothetical protein